LKAAPFLHAARHLISVALMHNARNIRLLTFDCGRFNANSELGRGLQLGEIV
jgi:hypothetical protein